MRVVRMVICISMDVFVGWVDVFCCGSDWGDGENSMGESEALSL